MKEYIRKIRQALGHMPILVCAASVIVENEKGEILLILRSDNKHWAHPGGAVDIDEAVEEAAKRELLEETRIHAHSLELFDVFSGKELHYVYPHGDEISNVDIVYICRDYSGTPKSDFIESDDIKFFPPDDLPVNISPPSLPVIKKYLEHIKAK